MLHSILQAASAQSFQGHHKTHFQHSTQETPQSPAEAGPPTNIRTNAFLRPNSAYREKRLPTTRPDHRRDPRVAAQNHLERTVSKSNFVTNDSNDEKTKLDGARTDALRRAFAPVANEYSISSNIARFGHDRDVLYTEGAPIRPKPIVNDIGDANHRTSSARTTAFTKGKPYIQVGLIRVASLEYHTDMALRRFTRKRYFTNITADIKFDDNYQLWLERVHKRFQRIIVTLYGRNIHYLRPI